MVNTIAHLGIDVIGRSGTSPLQLREAVVVDAAIALALPFAEVRRRRRHLGLHHPKDLQYCICDVNHCRRRAGGCHETLTDLDWMRVDIIWTAKKRAATGDLWQQLSGDLVNGDERCETMNKN
jgi:hypothetical protein